MPNRNSSAVTETLSISTRDGCQLAATLYSPTNCNDDSTSTIIINSGVAVRRWFYTRFAEFLCTQGFRVLTYDYRGIGDSLDGTINSCDANIHDWGNKDFPAVVTTISTRYPGDKIILVGHSFGGQILGLAQNCDQVSVMVSIATQSGYWKYWPAPRRFLMTGLWYLLMPALTTLFSYFPAKLLGIGENLPTGVARQWARWCRTPNYLRDDANASQTDYFEKYSGDILSISFDDDLAAPKPAVDALHAFYSAANVERRHIQASEFGAKPIGHFGFFKLSAKHPLWQQISAWLKAV